MCSLTIECVLEKGHPNGCSSLFKSFNKHRVHQQPLHTRGQKKNSISTRLDVCTYRYDVQAWVDNTWIDNPRMIYIHE